MPHRPRVLLADYPLHIVQRGINREPCFFTDEDYYCYLHWQEESARACGCALHAYALMTNHVHLMIRAKEGYLLQDIVRDFKKFSCKAVIKAIKENYEESRKEWLLKQLETKEGYSLWRGDNKPIELWSNAVITQKLNYIHQNPVEEGLVFKAEDYMYSSAYDYTGENGMIDILVID